MRLGVDTLGVVDGAVLQLVVLQRLGVDTLGVVDGAVPLGDADTRGPGTREVAARVQTHVTEPLHDVGLAAPAGEVADHGHVETLVDEVVEAVEHAAPSRTRAAVDTALVDGFSRDTGAGVHVRVSDGAGVGVRYPGHLPLSGPHVGGGNVDARPQEPLLGQLYGEPPCDVLQLVVAVLLVVDLDPSLAAAEGDVHTRALVGHQSGQGLHLVLAYVHGVPDASAAAEGDV